MHNTSNCLAKVGLVFGSTEPVGTLNMVADALDDHLRLLGVPDSSQLESMPPIFVRNMAGMVRISGPQVPLGVLFVTWS